MVLNILKLIATSWLVSFACLPMGHAQSDGRPVTVGAAEAPVNLDLYFSYACPHCLGLLSDVQADIDRALASKNLQINYLEVPAALIASTNATQETYARAQKRSKAFSSHMQCLVQQGGGDAVQNAHNALPIVLKSLVGESRTLPLEDAPSNQLDWQYWPWVEAPDDTSERVAQSLFAVLGHDISSCQTNSFGNAAIWNARQRRLGELKRRSVPELVVNGELVPPGEAHFERVTTILSSVDTIATILNADFAVETMRVTEPRPLRGAVIDDIDRELTKRVMMRTPSERYHVSFGPDETRITNRGDAVARYVDAPLLEFLFFGTKVSVLKEIETTSVGSAATHAFTDLTGNSLFVTMSGEQITSLYYKSADIEQWRFEMEAR